MLRSLKKTKILIKRGFDSELDDPFADPAKGGWAIERHQEISLMELQGHVSIEDLMHELFFETEKKIMLEHLVDVEPAPKADLEWQKIAAKTTIANMFKKKKMAPVLQEHWWAQLESRGLPSDVRQKKRATYP